jgi:hypothetical protein
MRFTKVMALAIVGLMIVSGSLFFISSSVKAFPTSSPHSSEYLFNDDFEGALSGWTTVIGSPSIVTNKSFNGTHSLYFHGTDDQYIRNSFPALHNQAVVVETQWYDSSTDTGNAGIYVSNATKEIFLGIRNSISTTDYGVNDGINYRIAEHRSTGWHNLKIHLQDEVANLYIGNTLVGNYNLTNPTLYGFRKFTTPEYHCWIDQFIVYDLFQDQIVHRVYKAVIDQVSWHTIDNCEPAVIYDAGIFKMWYRGGNGSGPDGLGYATSTDGINFTDYGTGPVVPGNQLLFNPSVTKIGSLYYLTGRGDSGAAICAKNSSDGINWWGSVTLFPNGTSADWDYSFGNNCLWKEGSTWYVIYEARSIATSYLWRLGLASSLDGVTWTKYSGNPILGNNSVTAGGPDVHKVGSTYYMLYHYNMIATETGGIPTDVGLVKSTDLIHWTNATFSEFIYRDQHRTFEKEQIADPFWIDVGGKGYFYYCGSSNGSDGKIYVATSDYTFAEVAQGNISQWGKQWIGNIGATNAISPTWPRTYWYSGVNALKGTYIYDINATFTGWLNVTINAWNPTSIGYGAVIADIITDKEAMITLIGLNTSLKYSGDFNGRSLFSGNYGPIVTFAMPSSGEVSITLGLYKGTIGTLVQLILFMFTLGVFMIPVNQLREYLKTKRIPTAQDAIRMAVLIIIGCASIGIITSMI